MRNDILDIVDAQTTVTDKKQLQLPFEAMVTSYEMILSDVEFLSYFEWDILVVDEAHRLKNHNTALYTCLMNDFEVHHKVLLTGTPVHNNIVELWALLHFCMPALFDQLNKFEALFDNGEHMDELHTVLKTFMLRRHKADVLKDLPSKSEIILYTKLTSIQKRLYKGLLTRDKEALGSKNKKALNNSTTMTCANADTISCNQFAQMYQSPLLV